MYIFKLMATHKCYPVNEKEHIGFGGLRLKRNPFFYYLQQ